MIVKYLRLANEKEKKRSNNEVVATRLSGFHQNGSNEASHFCAIFFFFINRLSLTRLIVLIDPVDVIALILRSANQICRITQRACNSKCGQSRASTTTETVQLHLIS